MVKLEFNHLHNPNARGITVGGKASEDHQPGCYSRGPEAKPLMVQQREDSQVPRQGLHLSIGLCCLEIKPEIMR